MYRTKNLNITADLKVSKLILNDPYLMLMLEHFGIDVPLHDKTIDDVCRESNINSELFLTFANLYNDVQHTYDNSFSYNDITTIINYLKNSHKYYSDEIYPNILSIIKQMNIANNHKEMALVEKFFEEYFSEVTEHLEYENNIVFPYIIELYKKTVDPKQSFSIDEYSVSEYKDHHDDIEEKLIDLKNLLIKYLPQKDDFAIRRKLLFCLSELEYDLDIHSSIEDLILIPIVTEMEKQVKTIG